MIMDLKDNFSKRQRIESWIKSREGVTYPLRLYWCTRWLHHPLQQAQTMHCSQRTILWCIIASWMLPKSTLCYSVLNNHFLNAGYSDSIYSHNMGKLPEGRLWGISCAGTAGSTIDVAVISDFGSVFALSNWVCSSEFVLCNASFKDVNSLILLFSWLDSSSNSAHLVSSSEQTSVRSSITELWPEIMWLECWQ